MTIHSLSAAIDLLIDRLDQMATQTSPTEARQLALPVTPVALLPWLATQDLYPKIYWRGRDGDEEVAALGSCRDLSLAPHRGIDEMSADLLSTDACTTGQRYYGGIAFDGQGQGWPDFGAGRFILPNIEIRRSLDSFQLLINLCQAHNHQDLMATKDKLKRLGHSLAPMTGLRPEFKGRRDRPTYDGWRSLVERITAAEFNAHTPKVVLARTTELESTEPVDPWRLLADWQACSTNSFQFGFQFSAERCFISCSPERLFRRRGKTLQTEALAGTTTRGDSPAQDAQLALELLQDAKNGEENRLVQQDILDTLAPLCTEVSVDAPTIFPLNHIQHLHCAIRARLRPEVDDLRLLQALHPTPAVGGYPRAAALRFIRQEEELSRGWYAGACGYLNHRESEFAVAIRSALVAPAGITLFAGAGIVAGSNAANEWQELDNKLTTILSVLSQPCHTAPV